MYRRLIRWKAVALGALITVGIAAGVATAAVRDAESLQGVSVALFAAFLVFAYFSRRPGQGWTQNWSTYVGGAILARLFAGFVHLYVAFYLFNQMVDFVGLHEWVLEASSRLLVGSLHELETFGVLESGAVALIMAPLAIFIGSSIAGMLLVSGLLGFIGSYLFLRSFQIAGPAGGDMQFLTRVMFFLPGFVFWGSLFGKDSLMFLCLGAATYCLARLTHRLQIGTALGLGISLGVITIIRPHVGAALGASIGIAWFTSRMSRPGPDAVLVPVRLAFRTAVLVALIAVPIFLLSSMMKFVSIEAVYKDMARRHYVLSSAGDDAGLGGLGSSLPPRLTGDSPWEFLAYLPEGFTTFIFRPLPFDAHNTQALVASSEGVLLVAIVLWRLKNLGRSVRTMWSSPYLTLITTYFFLATTALCFERNLGLIARHKIMVLPFLMLMLAVPRKSPPRPTRRRPYLDDHRYPSPVRDERGTFQ